LLVVVLEEEIMVVAVVLVDLCFMAILHQIKLQMVQHNHLMEVILLLLVKVALVDSIRKTAGQG
jgi:hypothetical protein